jgi:hypothetical protein
MPVHNLNSPPPMACLLDVLWGLAVALTRSPKAGGRTMLAAEMPHLIWACIAERSPRELAFPVCLVLALNICTSASGATLTKAIVKGTVQQFTDNGAISGCGLTVVALQIPDSHQGQISLFNGSFSLLGMAGGIVKGRAAEVDAAIVRAGKIEPKSIKPLQTTYVWMRAPGSEVTMPVAGTSLGKSEDPGYLIYVSNLQSVLGLLDAVQERKAIQLGTRVKGQTADQALYGVVDLSDDDLEQLTLCVQDWSKVVLEKARQDDGSLSKPDE